VSSLQRSLYKDYRIEIAAGPGDALEAIAQTSYAVVVSDLKMPGMSGIDLLTTVKEASPDTVRILLTGQADLDTAIAAVNEGSIFRFLTKPCPQELLKRTLDAALEQHALQVSEKNVLRETLMGTVAVLVEILSTIQPLAFGRASRIRHYVWRLASELHLPETWEYEAAALLSQVGYISVEPSVLKKYFEGVTLSPEEAAQILSQATVGQRLLHQIPRLHAVSQIIGRQYQAFEDRTGLNPAEFTIAIGTQMLRAAIDFDRLMAKGMSADKAIAEMRSHEADYNPEVFAALQRIQFDLVMEALTPPDDRAELVSDGRMFRPITEEVLRTLRD
jgi:response regulator RpfG family c-di-GMP phosphodiesterase